MTPADCGNPEVRVLVLAPTGKDAVLTQSVLAGADIACVVCSSLNEVCEQLHVGAGAVLLAEEAIPGQNGRLAEWLGNQPPWSDLPVLVLARPGADSAAVARAMDLLGNVIVVERPTRVATLVSVVRTALRARKRQYEARSHLSCIQRNERRLSDIFRNAGVSLWEEDFSGVQTAIDALREQGVTDFARYFQEHPEFVQRALEAVRVLDVNDATVTMFEAQDKQELLGALPDIFGPESRHVFLGELLAVAEGKTWFQSEALLRTIRHNPVYVYFTMVLPEPGQPCDRVLFSILDISERKRAEEALKDADRRKDEFLAVLAHELRNPLAPIRNSLHILRLSATNDPASERVAEMLERQVNHMVRLVDDLLEVSRITRGKIELRKELVELASIVRSAVETSRPHIESAGHQLALAIPADPLTVEGDPVRLSQVIANLLINAAKYTPAGGQIWLSIGREGDMAAISVRDSGRGIPAPVLSRVFDLFMQVDSEAGKSQGGLGIGLSLVKSLVEMHGGSVTAHSDGPGCGSEFVVHLPLAAPGTSARLARSDDSSSAGLAARRVLVVDDNRDAAQSLGLLLKLMGADVHIVFNGPDALEALATYKPTVILLDIGMPGMDGHEVARRIRQQSEFADVILIALTGWGKEEDRQRSETAGFDYHLIKPADVDALQSLLLSLEDGGGSRRSGSDR